MAAPLARLTETVPMRAWVDTLVLTVLALIGILGFAPSFSDSAYLVAGIGGLLVGTFAAVAASVARLGIIGSAAVAVGSYFIFGSPFAMPEQALARVFPSLDSLAGLATGAVFGWADIVTLTTPVAAPDYIGVLPYLAACLAGLGAGTVATRWFAANQRGAVSSMLALFAPISIYVLSVITGTSEPFFAAVRGIAFALIALVWMSWRVHVKAATNPGTRSAIFGSRLIGISAVLAVAVIGGGLVGAAAAPPAEDRFVLRDELQPPFDPLLYPSPLSGFRHYTQPVPDGVDPVLFTVSGLAPGDRIRVATMDAFTGKLWTATDPELRPEGTGAFGLVSGVLPEPPTSINGSTIHATVVIGSYADVWLPVVGYPESITFEAGSEPKSTSLRFNAATGNAVDTDVLRAGDSYDLVAVRPEFSDAELTDAAVANDETQLIENVPPIVGSQAQELAGGALTPIDKLRSIETELRENSYLTHGRASEQFPSSAGHGTDRIKPLLERKYRYGDGEQFASAFALMATSMGYPARVIMGFAPEVTTGRPVEVTGNDVDAWIEVHFDQIGWVPFYPTPYQLEVPIDQEPQPRLEPQKQVRQPPRSALEGDDLVTAVKIDDPGDDNGFTIPSWVWTVAASVLIPLSLYFIPLLAIASFKTRRRRRRREEGPADRRAAGAWDELVDVYSELGYQAPREATRVELALLFEAQFRHEVAERERERRDVERRAAIRAEREQIKRAAAETARNSSEAPARLNAARVSGLLDATVLRAREAAAWRPGVTDSSDPLPVLSGLREFAVLTDRSAFSGKSVSDQEVDETWSHLQPAALAARASVSWFRRRLSVFRLRSSRDILARFTQKLTERVATSARKNQGTGTPVVSWERN